MTTTETQQLTIARAIQKAIEDHTGEPGWATESMMGGHAQRGACDGQCDDAHYHRDGCPRRVTTPRPLTTLADARAAWVASGGDPERGPATTWSSNGNHIEVIIHDDRMSVRVGALVWCPTREWEPFHVAKAWLKDGNGFDLAPDLDLMARIVRAVEEVTPCPLTT